MRVCDEEALRGGSSLFIYQGQLALQAYSTVAPANNAVDVRHPYVMGFSSGRQSDCGPQIQKLPACTEASKWAP